MTEGNLELRLKGMLARIFSDAVVDDRERAELGQLRTQIPPERVEAVMADFLKATLQHALADGQVTDRERQRLRVILEELALPREKVPEEVWDIVGV